MLQNQGKQRVRRRRSAGRQAVFMDVISLMERVSELTSSSYSPPSCRGSRGIRPVEMRLYHRHTSHQIRCVLGHFKKNCGSFLHFLIALLFPQFHFLSLFHTHTRTRCTDGHNSDMLENKPGQFRFLRGRGGGVEGYNLPHILFLKSRHINRFCLSHTQRLCRWIAEEGSGPEQHWRRPGGPPARLLGLQGPGMLIGKIVLIRPSSLQMLGEGKSEGPHRQEGSSQWDIVSKHNWHNVGRAM